MELYYEVEVDAVTASQMVWGKRKFRKAPESWRPDWWPGSCLRSVTVFVADYDMTRPQMFQAPIKLEVEKKIHDLICSCNISLTYCVTLMPVKVHYKITIGL